MNLDTITGLTAAEVNARIAAGQTNDAHEETSRSLKDILAAGNDPTMFEWMDNLAPFALIGASNFASETCVVAPSLLIDDLELHPVQEEMPKLPIVPPPDSGR